MSFIIKAICMIPRWLEHRTYSYQKYTLPIKLRNLSIIFKVYKLAYLFFIKHTILKNTIKYNKYYNYLYKHARALRLELRIWSLKLHVLPIKLSSLFSFLYTRTEKRWFEHPGVNTQYLANILPYLWQLFLETIIIRIRSATIRHLLSRQESPLPIKLLILQ